jgi:hypothetical protein
MCLTQVLQVVNLKKCKTVTASSQDTRKSEKHFFCSWAKAKETTHVGEVQGIDKHRALTKCYFDFILNKAERWIVRKVVIKDSK